MAGDFPTTVALPRILRHIAAAGPSCGHTVVVAVDGPSGSGKTTLAGQLARALPGAALVPMDDLYPGWDGLAEAVPSLCRQVLEPLAGGARAAYVRYDWVSEQFAETVEVPAADVLIVEGVGSSAGPCTEHLAVRVWVEADRAARMARGLARDGEAFRPHWQSWAVQEESLFAADGTRSRADLIIDTTP